MRNSPIGLFLQLKAKTVNFKNESTVSEYSVITPVLTQDSSNYSTDIKMDDLPVLVLQEIFSFLNIQEKLRVRSVCRQFKFIVETVNHQRNLCLYSTGYPYNQRWCFSKQKVMEEDMLYLQLEIDLDNSRKFDLQIEFLRNLQMLYLHRVGPKIDYFLEQVNCLCKLKVLMIDGSRIKLEKLSSSCLEKLSLRNCGFRLIELDTPNLTSFVLWNDEGAIEFAVFRFPLKVKHLECFQFDSSVLMGLKNLETRLSRDHQRF